MGFFSSLFGPKFTPEELNVEVNEIGIFIRNSNLVLPCAIIELVAVIGKPSNQVRTNVGVNYFWNKYGIMCYTHDGINVHTINVTVNDTTLAPAPQGFQMFRGTLTIQNRHWESVMRTGKKTEFFNQIMLGSFSVVSEYYDFMDDRILSGIEASVDPAIVGNYSSMVEDYANENYGG